MTGGDFGVSSASVNITVLKLLVLTMVHHLSMLSSSQWHVVDVFLNHEADDPALTSSPPQKDEVGSSSRTRALPEMVSAIESQLLLAGYVGVFDTSVCGLLFQHDGVSDTFIFNRNSHNMNGGNCQRDKSWRHSFIQRYFSTDIL